MASNLEFDPNLVWVTGGSRGIGAAVADKLESDHLKVVRLHSGLMDLKNPDSRQNWLKEQFQIPGTLILNAGINFPECFENQSDHDFNQILEVNLLANRDIMMQVLPVMKENKFGRIVIVSSLYATRARVGRSAYSISKAGVESLARSVAIEYAENGILINVVAPGFVLTDLTIQNNDATEIRKIQEKIPLKRLAEVEEIAEVVSFLSGKKNTYLTGQTIYVDGGISIT